MENKNLLIYACALASAVPGRLAGCNPPRADPWTQRVPPGAAAARAAGDAVAARCPSAGRFAFPLQPPSLPFSGCSPAIAALRAAPAGISAGAHVLYAPVRADAAAPLPIRPTLVFYGVFFSAPGPWLVAPRWCRRCPTGSLALSPGRVCCPRPASPSMTHSASTSPSRSLQR